MGYYKLLSICRHKQLNECINIDDMLQGLWQEYTTPSGYGWASASPPTLSYVRDVHMYVTEMVGEDLEGFIIWITRRGQISRLHPQCYSNHRMHYLASTFLASCSLFLIWHARESAEAWRAVLIKIYSMIFMHLARAQITFRSTNYQLHIPTLHLRQPVSSR